MVGVRCWERMREESCLGWKKGWNGIREAGKDERRGGEFWKQGEGSGEEKSGGLMMGQ